MVSDITVIKRDGSKQPLDLDKFHKVVSHACEGITGVSASEVELKSHIQFYNNIKSSDIQETLIKAAANLISEDTPNYQHVAGRLINYHLRKQVYGSYTPPSLREHVERVSGKGLYDNEILSYYDDDEWDKLDKIVKHTRDEHLTFAAMEQFRGKYLVQDRSTNEIFETPQFAYILIAAVLFHEYPKQERLEWIKRYYDAISMQEITLATPVIAGIRTPERQYASCTLIECGDSRDSIKATTNAIVDYVSARAGIGIGAGGIRAVDSSVQGGAKIHTGVRPFYRMFQSAVKSCSQGGIRGGAATLNYMFWHYEFEDLIVLKNGKGTDENRLRQMDYCIQLNRLFYQRYLEGGNITFFSPHDVPELYEAFFSDQDKFEELYQRAENNTRLRKKTLSAKEVFETILDERFTTGRVYTMNVDHANTHGSFRPELAPIRMTNLCVEITLPTVPVSLDGSGEIALCILSAINMGAVRDDQHLEELCRLAVHALNCLIDFQEYPQEQAKRATEKRRPLGIGISNLAYWLAKNDMSYTNCDYDQLDEFFEAYSYYLIKASSEATKYHGACPGYDDTKYSQGIVPLDTYKADVDQLTSRKPTKDWDGLRKMIQRDKMANSTLMAGMPSETSSQAANATSGFDPIRSLITVKQSKDGVLSQVVPEYWKLKNKYEPLWEIKDARSMIYVAAVAQKWMDQSISTNTSYNPLHYPNQKVPQSILGRDVLTAYKFGLKTLYYNNTNDQAGEEQVEDCESCKL